jgi:2-amino-4-hydroxy-6-hydroxymethyldihydropteridine diphosphokinase
MRVAGVGGPRRVLARALTAIETAGVAIDAASPIFDSAPLGPSARRYANGAAIVVTDLLPPALFATLQRIEYAFGRRRRGGRWRARPLDLDIVLWSGGAWSEAGLTIPHTAFRERFFVMAPAAAIAADWRDPVSGLTLRHLRARLTHPRLVPSERAWSGP